MNFAKFLIRRGSDGEKESYKRSKILWFGRWRDEVTEFGNCDGGGDQSDYEGRMRGGIIGVNGGGSQGVGVHKVVPLVLHSIGR